MFPGIQRGECCFNMKLRRYAYSNDVHGRILQQTVEVWITTGDVKLVSHAIQTIFVNVRNRDYFYVGQKLQRPQVSVSGDLSTSDEAQPDRFQFFSHELGSFPPLHDFQPRATSSVTNGRGGPQVLKLMMPS